MVCDVGTNTPEPTEKRDGESEERTMTKNDKIEELERRIRELEARPIPPPIIINPYPITTSSATACWICGKTYPHTCVFC